MTRGRMRGVTILSSVRVGVIDELAEMLRARLGVPVTVRSALSDEEWRRARGSSPLASWRARLAGLLFPFRAGRAAAADDGIVIATTNPFWLPAVVAGNRGGPRIVLVYDVYPDAISARWSLPTWLERLIDSIVAKGLRGTDAIVVLGDRVRSALQERFPGIGPITVIATGADPDRYLGSPLAVLPIPVPEDAVLISYVGNTGSVHDGRTAGQAIAAAIGRNPTARAIVATRGDRASELTAPLRGTERTHLCSGLDDTEYRATMRRSDVAVVTLGQGAAIASVPSKLFAALASGCAVLAIAPSDSDLADLVHRTRSGVVVAPGDVDAATAALDLLIRDTDLRLEYSQNAAAAAIEHSPAVLATRWESIIGPMLSSATPD